MEEEKRILSKWKTFEQLIKGSGQIVVHVQRHSPQISVILTYTYVQEGAPLWSSEENSQSLNYFLRPAQTTVISFYQNSEVWFKNKVQ